MLTNSHTLKANTAAGTGGTEYKNPVSSGLSNVEGGRADVSNSYLDTLSAAGQGTVSGSPLLTVQRDSSWPTDGLQNMHLSSHEPRYIPGMVTRASRRRDGLRRSSAHESDDVASPRNNIKRNGGREEPT